MQSHFLFFILALVALTTSHSAHAKAPHARNVARPRARAAADLDAAQSSEASLALSIYNNVGTTAFAAATAGACAVGYQTYTAASGTVRCCVGSVVDGICFSDTEDIVYDADPEAVLDGSVDPPTVDSTATAAAGTVVVGTATSTSTTSTINYLTATSYKATATGGTSAAAAADADEATTSTSYSQLSQSLTPTGSGTASTSKSGAGGLAVDVGMIGLLGSLVAILAGGGVAML
ncbi:hypothetical protein BCV69DRAFT_284505 [Microstroma glucosiphilum]|uniref:Uncharacterized protein n=1 Tax=Pseudomicrostroma glucosiphilum TaxID=1684307 RepID=A0A316U7G2_9BASI|nr:hypothetical protein BCV69DRAFT_284505 [Pseudomicrostroma glucosiphilum]PWN18885.1 hypothetical protein BCV69DRAFT_284505 [Pseudomicrostroma glucosiphilum]